jgi:uncharacterized protein YjaG (DUF416 family)
MRKRLENIGTWVLVTFLALVLVGILFEQYTRWRLERHLLDGKTFVSVNGHKIHYVKKGRGAYTVVFESGLGSDHTIWQRKKVGMWFRLSSPI